MTFEQSRELMKVLKGKTKFRRLLWLVFRLGLLSATVGFVLGYLWDYGFSLTGLTRELIAARAVDALKSGMLGGIYGGFPVWLVLEKFSTKEAGSRGTSLER